MILEIRDLVIDYAMPRGDIHAVRNLSLDLHEGEILGVIGESGSGKSTLGYAIPRLLPPPGVIRSGKILIEGENVLELRESELNRIRGKKVTYVPQGAQNALNPLFTVEHQIADPIRHHKHTDWKDALRQTRASLELVGISAKRTGEYPRQYSGGMKQRSLIAMALALDSEMVILDEPTTALDVVVQKQVFELVKEVRKEFQTAFLLISHDLAIVSTVCDRIAIMYAGRIVEEAPTREIFDRPKHPYTKALISSLPRIHFSDEALEPIYGSPPNLANLPSGCAFHPRCKYAIEKCKQEMPELEQIEENHLAACFLAKEM